MAEPTQSPAPTLNEALKALGLTTRPTEDTDLKAAARGGRKDILDGERVLAWGVDAEGGWTFLRECLVCPHCGAVERARAMGEAFDEDFGERVDWYECEECTLSWAPQLEGEAA